MGDELCYHMAPCFMRTSSISARSSFRAQANGVIHTWLECPITIAHQHTDGSVESIRGRQVYFVVVVEICGDDSVRQ